MGKLGAVRARYAGGVMPGLILVGPTYRSNQRGGFADMQEPGHDCYIPGSPCVMAAGVERDSETRYTPAGKRLWAFRVVPRAILAWFGLSVFAAAHIPDHPEWNRVLSASRNQENRPCCSLGDAHLVEFDEWRRTSHGNYEVYIRGEWHRIEPWKITTNVVNPTGKAIVWYELVACEWADCASNTGWVWILCFKPLDTY